MLLFLASLPANIWSVADWLQALSPSETIAMPM